MTRSVDDVQRVTDSMAEDLLSDLVSIASPTFEESSAVNYLVHWMSAHSFDDAYVDEAGNAVGIRGKGQRDVVLLGHIDTFGGMPTVCRDGRILYARGAVDAKGPLCTFVVAASRAIIPDDIRLIVIGAVEEEASTSKGARHAARVFSPAMCIIGEPSAWDRITLGYKGRLLLDWRWNGPLAHSAGRALSPAERAVTYWQRVSTFVDTHNLGTRGLFDRLDATLQQIQSGQDGAYGWASMTIGLRLPPGFEPQSLPGELIVDDDANIRVYGAERCFVADRDNVLSRAMRGAIRKEGGQPRFVHKTGTSDMNIVGPIWNCPIVAYGPGDSALDHTPDEHINLDEYLKSCRVLTTVLENL